MKLFPFRTLLLLLAPLCAFAGTATIKIDVDRVVDQVDPRIYGVFMEPIGFNRADLHFNTLCSSSRCCSTSRQSGDSRARLGL